MPQQFTNDELLTIATALANHAHYFRKSADLAVDFKLIEKFNAKADAVDALFEKTTALVGNDNIEGD